MSVLPRASFVIRLATVALCLGPLSAAWAQPVNDECAGATPIPLGSCSFATGTNVDATDSSEGTPPIATTPCFYAGGDIWFSVQVPASGQVTLNRLASELATTITAAYTGTCGSLTPINVGGVHCASGTSRVATGLTPFTTLYWRVWESGNDDFGEVSFSAIDPTAVVPIPGNDNCGATLPSITVAASEGACSSTFVCTNGATGSLPVSCGTAAAMNDDVWYTLTTPVAFSGKIMVKFDNIMTVATTAPAIGVAVYSTCSGAPVACSTGSAGTAPDPDYSSLFTGLAANTTYLVRVWLTSTTVGSGAMFDMCVFQPPANDECASPTPIGVAASEAACTPFQVYTNGATPSAQTGPCATTAMNDDVWYSFTAPAIGAVQIRFDDIVGGSIIGYAVYSTCGSPTPVICDTASTGAEPDPDYSDPITGLSAGTYLLRVWLSPTTGGGSWDMCVYELPPIPGNNECAGATNVSVAANEAACVDLHVSTASATQSTPNPSCSTGSAHNDDVWYSFTAPASGRVQIRYSNIAGGTAVGTAIYTSCVAGEVFCDATSAGTAPDPDYTDPINNLTPFATYFLRVWLTTTTAAGNWDMCVFALPPAPPNDNCANALSVAVAPAEASCTDIAIDTTNASQSSQTSCATTAMNDDVWFSFTVPLGGTGSVQVRYSNIVGGTATGIGTAIYTACGGTQVMCDTASVGTAPDPDYSDPVNGLTLGQTYLLRTWLTSTTGGGTWDMCVFELPPPPPNDECASATPVPVAANEAACVPNFVSTVSATQSSPDPSCTSTLNNDDVWFSFTAPASGNIQIRFDDITGGTVVGLALYEGCSGAQVACDTSSVGTAPDPDYSDPILGLTPLAPYVLRVWLSPALGYGTWEQCIFALPPAPPNDNCAGALLVPVTTETACVPTPVNTLTATQSSPNPSCSTTNNDDVWFSFVAPASGTVMFRFSDIVGNPGAASTIGAAVYSGCVGGELFCDAGSVGTAPAADYTDQVTGLASGTTYFLRVWVTTATGGGTFDLCIFEPPLNDECSGATVIPVSPELTPVSVCGSNRNATSSLPVPTAPCTTSATGFDGGDIWFQSTVPGSGNLTLAETVDSPWSTEYAAAYIGTCPNALTLVACLNTTMSATNPLQVTGLPPGGTVYWRLWESGNDSFGEICLNVFEPPLPPSNDACAGAFPVPVAPSQAACAPIPVDTTLALPSTPPPSCATTAADDDVWYQFFAPLSGRVQVQVSGFTGSSTAVGVAVYDACGGTEVGCDSGTFGTAPAPDLSDIFGGLASGQPYQLRVWTTSTAAGGTFNLCIFDPPPAPTNDECPGAFAVTVAPDQASCVGTPIDTTAASRSVPNPSCSTGQAQNDDVWVSFTAPATGRVQVEVENFTGPSTAVGVALYDACGGNEVACDSGTLGTAPAPDLSDIFSGLTAGETYFLRVWTTGLAEGGTFNLCVFTIPPPPPNDTICGAEPIACGGTAFGNTSHGFPDTAPECDTTDGTGGALWYKYEPGASRSCVTVSTCNPGTTFDTKLRVYTIEGNSCFAADPTFDGDPDNLDCVAGDDDAGTLCPASTLRSIVQFTAEPFQTYWILVHGFGAASGPVELTLSCVFPPDNDDACGARPAVVGGLTPYDNACAGPSPVDPGVGTGTVACNSQDGWCDTGAEPISDNDVWFTFVAPPSGCVSIGTDNTNDLQLAVWDVEDCSDSLTFVELAANDDGGPGADPFIDKVACLTPGRTYHVQLDGLNGLQSAGNIRITDCGGLLTCVTVGGCQTRFLTGEAGIEATNHLNAEGCGGPSGDGSGLTYAWLPQTAIVARSCDNSTISVQPTETTTYTVTVTDANGCTASASVTVHVVDATADCTTAGNEKVTVCHVPPGNPEGAHEICIDSAALDAHMAPPVGSGIGHGTCYIGPCDTACTSVGTPPQPTPATCTPEHLDDFDPTIDLAQWSSLVNVVPSGSCGSETSPNGLLFNGQVPRTAVTRLLAVGPDSAIRFDVQHPTDLSSPCEVPETTDNLFVEWSTDLGATWHRIRTVVAGTTPTWTEVTARIPEEAICGEDVLIRFHQVGTGTSAPSFDNWIIDNVEIVCVGPVVPPGPCNPTAIDDFDPAIDPLAWAAISGATASTDCGSVSGNALRFESASGVQRSAETAPLVVGTGSALQFDLRFGTGTAASGCENADGGEDVVLEVFDEVFGMWTILATYDTEAYLTFTTVTQPIPDAYAGPNARFRLRQLVHSGADSDNWAIDNVAIVCP